MCKLLMIADDFTGAADSGVQMVKNGIEAHMAFDADKIDPEKSYIIDTESRNRPAEEAYQKVKRVFEKIRPDSYDYFYKKIDSTLRGNLKSEVKAAEEMLQPDLVVFNPANPESNRTVVDGILMMNGVRICETEIMRDPLCRVREDNLKVLLETEMGEKTQFFTLAQIRSRELSLDGSRYITFDVLENNDMHTVVKFILEQNKKVLWVGSAGMANALMYILQPHYPVLGIIGSISETSRGQVRVALNEGAGLVEVNIADLIQGGTVQNIIDAAVERLKMGQDVLLVSAKEHEDYLRAVDTGEKAGMTRQQVAQYTQAKLGEITARILDRAKVCGCFMTGGDTSISVNDFTHSQGAKLITEVEPIVPLIELEGGDHPGLRCIVKGGSIGSPDTIANAIRFLKK